MITETLYKCGKPDCERLCRPGILYCCAPCRIAADGGYEIDVHSEGCDERWDHRRRSTGDIAS